MHYLIYGYLFCRKLFVLCLCIVFCSVSTSHNSHAQSSNATLVKQQLPQNRTTEDQIITPWLGTDEPLNILVVMSFSPLIPWSQDVQQGLISAVNSQDKPINLYIESMYESPAHLNSARYNFDLSLREKYANVQFDGIIADSRSAYEYLQALPEDDPFFKDIPTYYLYFTLTPPKFEREEKTIIGPQIETVNQTLSHLFSARPNLKKLHIIANNRYVYEPYTTLVEQFIANNALNIELQYYQYNDLDSYTQVLPSIPTTDAIIYLPTFISSAKTNLNAAQVLSAISPFSPVPIYSFWHNFVGKGAVGGYMMNSHLYASDALHNLIKFKETGKFESNPNLGEWIFDYKQLKKFNFSEPNHLPNIKIINTPSTIWEDYPKETTMIIVAAALLLLALFWYKQNVLVHALKQSKQAERTAETNALRIAALSTTKSKFMATMSHEIRTPINGMFGALSLLSKQNPTPIQKKYLDIAMYCSENLLNTVNDVLDFSKLDSGQFEFTHQPFSPHHLMQQVEQYAVLISKDSDLRIILDINQLVDVPLLGDELRLQQVLNNLINNSVKFTSFGSITIAAKIQATFVPNHYQLEVSVTDTGIGIAPKDLDKLFTPFIQINDTLERTKEGSGLGLSICKELIKLMDGKISVESTEGKGSCFSFFVVLPQAMEGLPSKYVDNESDTELALSVPALQILLVEDNEINQEVMKAQLSQMGHDVCIANNGQCAFDMLATDQVPIDVILMDIQMPVLNGYDATVAIRSGKAGERYKEIPIIALSAHANLHEQPEYDLALFSAYLVKPAKETDLQHTLHEVMQSQ